MLKQNLVKEQKLDGRIAAADHSQQGPEDNLGDITQLLKGWNADRDGTLEQLTPLVYEELHKIARNQMRGLRPDHTLQATALINEAYLHLVRRDEVSFADRAHFFALAARVMRGILVDFARERSAQKRGSGGKVQVEDMDSLLDRQISNFLEVHQALERLELVDPRKAAAIELRYFGGLTFQEIAEVQSISLITAKRDSAFAEAWLRRSIDGESVGAPTA